MQITGQTLNTEKVGGRKVKDIRIVMRLVNATSTGTVTVLPNLRTVTCKLELWRAGKMHKIFEDNLQNLAVESHYETGLEPIVNASYLVQKGGGAALLPITLKMHGPIDVHGTDRLELTINVLPGTYAGVSFNAALCVLDCNFVDAHGVEEAIPFIGVRYMQGGANSWTENLGDHVHNVSLLNYDQGFGSLYPISDAAVVFQNVQITSEGLNLNETADRIQTRILHAFETATAANFRGQCVQLNASHSHAHMHKVQLTATLNAALNTSGNNVIMWRYFEPCATTAARAVAVHQAHNAATTQRLSARGIHNHHGVHSGRPGLLSHGTRR